MGKSYTQSTDGVSIRASIKDQKVLVRGFFLRKKVFEITFTVQEWSTLKFGNMDYIQRKFLKDKYEQMFGDYTTREPDIDALVERVIDAMHRAVKGILASV